MSNKITHRYYLKGVLRNTAPLLIGSGGSDVADIEMVKDSDGNPMIPGTSIAGVLRSFCGDEAFFGGTDDNAELSPVRTYHAVVTDKECVVRDGVKLNYLTKTALETGKYDYEVIEPGSKFEFRMEMVIREQNKFDILDDAFHSLINALRDGVVVFGAKTMRGLGDVVLENAQLLALKMPEDKDKWIKFDWDESAFDSVIRETGSMCKNEINVEFAIVDSLLIRSYAKKAEGDDSSHLSYADGSSVVSGTSWGGLLRSTCWHILKELQAEEIDNKLNCIFGYVDEDNKQAKKSKIRISESVITGGNKLSYTRNKIDRFTGGTVDGALFSHSPHYGGKVCLKLSIGGLEQWERGLVRLALKDIGNGIRPLGGETSVGRGTLQADIELIDEEMQALASVIGGQK